MSPSKFTWELYIGSVGYSITDVMDRDGNFFPEVVVLGTCDAAELRVRPRPGEAATMIEFNGDKMWLHTLKR